MKFAAISALLPALASASLIQPPEGKHWLGAWQLYNVDTTTQFNERLGHAASSFHFCFKFPIPPTTAEEVEGQLKATGTHAIALITFEPFGGLQEVTDEQIALAGEQLKKLTSGGRRVMVRFAHEMNAGWYPWGLQPALYRETYAKFAEGVRAVAPEVNMVWALNVGSGYPYGGQPKSECIKDLDTNGDGVVDSKDGRISSSRFRSI